ncbi:hypothetical protein [Alkaliphilus oremlandii]|uniref:hypothetical protein n=1 Tax=Alkaliphilus oremlandii TaxID=461876 RepID=UPI0002E10043|nr:hypothetical protein [Alkaliphilus oremlandii]
MNTKKIINLDEYRNKKNNRKDNQPNNINSSKEIEDDRKNTFDLFMKVLKTMRQESY